MVQIHFLDIAVVDDRNCVSRLDKAHEVAHVLKVVRVMYSSYDAATAAVLVEIGMLEHLYRVGRTFDSQRFVGDLVAQV